MLNSGVVFLLRAQQNNENKKTLSAGSPSVFASRCDAHFYAFASTTALHEVSQEKFACRQSGNIHPSRLRVYTAYTPAPHVRAIIMKVN